ncbi:hypothetical protein G6F31_014412 [Rhizopus arrhizus]|nr:hypothetical protein G6F31_014412 [Rhizopus arrhizus]
MAQQFAAGAGQRHGAVLEHVAVLGDLQRLAHVLLHQEQGQAVGVDGAQRTEDLLHDDRRQAHRRFVQQQQAGLGHQGPADGQHLLFAARQRARVLIPALFQAREHGKATLDLGGQFRGRLLAQEGAQHQVVEHGLGRDHLAAFRHVGDTQPHALVRTDATQVLPGERDGPRGLLEARQRAHHRALARAVAADDGHDLVRVHMQRRPLQCVDGAVADRQVFDIQ